MQTVAVIPARYASTRFPGKPLALLGGKPLIQWVYENTQQCRVIQQTIVATDDQRIVQAVRAFGGEVIVTRPDHPTGTDRIAEAASQLKADLIVNVQGDEPFVKTEQLEQLIDFFRDDRIDIATLAHPLRTQAAIFDPNVVKVVRDTSGRALYFSRAPIPYLRDTPPENWAAAKQHFQHLGIYAYRKVVLSAITQLPPSHLEQHESLEQLRWLQAGYTIQVGHTPFRSIGVDTPADLAAAEQLLAQ
ncbi:MAG: 3-deoxy-manno-octulosonate cytidylyltransferase [Bacteroidota bacterium]